MIKTFLYLLCLQIGIQAYKLEGYILDGKSSEIEDFPHSAYLESYCGEKRKLSCGSSILNQLILLTAAHCFPFIECAQPQRIIVRIGNINKFHGTEIEVSKYILHEDFYEKSLESDIALVMIKNPVTFASNIARVAIIKNSVIHGQMGAVAGWGYVFVDPKTKTDVLRHVNQKIVTRDRCQRILGKLPKGVFCAKDVMGKSYPTGGDSGSALIIDHYIQVGLVSYKMPKHPNTVVYTDVSYYYNWIENSTINLLCDSDNDH